MTGTLVMLAIVWGIIGLAWLHDSGRLRLWWYRRQARWIIAQARRRRR